MAEGRSHKVRSLSRATVSISNTHCLNNRFSILSPPWGSCLGYSLPCSTENYEVWGEETGFVNSQAGLALFCLFHFLDRFFPFERHGPTPVGIHAYLRRRCREKAR